MTIVVWGFSFDHNLMDRIIHEQSDRRVNATPS